MPINDKTPRPQEFAAVDLGSNSFHMVIAREVDGALQIIGRLKQRVHWRMVLMNAACSAKRRWSAA
jgi:exopolyphosphatase/guanosine-5'-triphosphate,3'-diphosphate pyrophosphatase